MGTKLFAESLTYWNGEYCKDTCGYKEIELDTEEVDGWVVSRRIAHDRVDQIDDHKDLK